MKIKFISGIAIAATIMKMPGILFFQSILQIYTNIVQEPINSDHLVNQSDPLERAAHNFIHDTDIEEELEFVKFTKVD